MNAAVGVVALLALAVSACNAPAQQPPRKQPHHSKPAVTAEQQRDHAKVDADLRKLQMDLRKLQFRMQPPAGAAGF